MELAWQAQGIIIFVVLLTFIMLGMPVAFSLGFVSLGGMLLFLGSDSLPALSHTIWTTSNVFIFAAIPLFFLLSEIITFSGISGDVFNAMRKWLNWLPGGLAIVSVFTCAIFGAICSNGVGVAAIVGTVALPEMFKHGYNKRMATAALASSSALGIVIPPSIPLIIYGMVTEQSVGRLFIAGVLPGLLVAGLYSAYIAFSVIRKPELAPTIPGGIIWKERITCMRNVWAIALLIVLIIGGIYAGIYTPTEAAAVGSVGAAIIAAVYRKLTWDKLRQSLMSSVKTTSMVMFIVLGAMLLGYLLTSLNIGQNLSAWVVGMNINRWIVFIIMNLIWLILGCFIDVGSIILITMPILYPIATALGFDPIWLAIILVINGCAAVITPPVGLCAFVVYSIVPEVSLSEIFRGVVPYLFIIAVSITILSIFPEIALVLPNMAFAR